MIAVGSPLTSAKPPSAESRFLTRTAAAFRPRPYADRTTWCGDTIRFNPKYTASDSRFDITDRPWIRGIFEAADDPDTEEITFVGPTQLGKTVVDWALMLSESELSPCPMMFIGPDQDYVREQRDKIYATAQVTPGVKDRIPPERKWNDRVIDLGDMYVYLAWTGSTQRMSGRPCKKIIWSEVDRSTEHPTEGATGKLIKERTKGFFRSLILREGTPIGDESQIIDDYDKSNRCLWLVACPYCGHRQELRFFLHKEGPYANCGGVGGLQDANGRWRSMDELADHVHYICEKGCRWKETDRMPAVRSGVWCPAGMTVGADGKLKGTPEQSNRHTGFTITSMVSPKISFLRIAQEYMDCRDKDRELRNFVNNWLAKKYFGRRRIPTWKEIGKRCEGSHRRGTVPADCLFLVCAVDLQLDWVAWRVRGFGEGGTSWGIDRGIIQATIGPDGMPVPSSDLKKIDTLLLDRYFPLVSPNAFGKKTLKIRLLGIDSQYHTLAAHNWRRSHPGDRVRTIGGDHKLTGALWEKKIVDKSAEEGVVYPGGLERWRVQVSEFQEELQQRWHADLTQPGAWFLEKGIIQDGEDFLRQLVNRRAVYELGPDGFKKKKMKDIDGRIRHEAFDTEVYCLALGDMVVDSNWTNLVERETYQPAVRGVARAEGSPRDDDDAPR